MLSVAHEGDPDPMTVEGTRCIVDMFYALRYSLTAFDRPPTVRRGTSDPVPIFIVLNREAKLL